MLYRHFQGSTTRQAGGSSCLQVHSVHRGFFWIKFWNKSLLRNWRLQGSSSSAKRRVFFPPYTAWFLVVLSVLMRSTITFSQLHLCSFFVIWRNWKISGDRKVLTGNTTGSAVMSKYFFCILVFISSPPAIPPKKTITHWALLYHLCIYFIYKVKWQKREKKPCVASSCCGR